MNYTVVINSAVWGGALLYYYIDARKWFVGMCHGYINQLPQANRFTFKDPKSPSN